MLNFFILVKLVLLLDKVSVFKLRLNFIMVSTTNIAGGRFETQGHPFAVGAPLLEASDDFSSF